MKKQVVLVLLALVGTLSTYAQVSFGIKAGYNNAGVSGGEGSEFTKRLSGFHVGGIADISLAENFSLQPQLLFIIKGA
ncbi:MAG TPA: outer membrane beta-barrel protein, partial [Niastella sp.]